jgi:hypothetical protein
MPHSPLSSIPSVKVGRTPCGVLLRRSKIGNTSCEGHWNATASSHSRRLTISSPTTS